MRFVLSIVLDAGTREVNKIHKNHALADILGMTQWCGSCARVMEAMQEGAGVVARMARKGLTADVNLTKTQK